MRRYAGSFQEPSARRIHKNRYPKALEDYGGKYFWLDYHKIRTLLLGKESISV